MSLFEKVSMLIEHNHSYQDHYDRSIELDYNKLSDKDKKVVDGIFIKLFKVGLGDIIKEYYINLKERVL